MNCNSVGYFMKQREIVDTWDRVKAAILVISSIE